MTDQADRMGRGSTADIRERLAAREATDVEQNDRLDSLDGGAPTDLLAAYILAKN